MRDRAEIAPLSLPFGGGGLPAPVPYTRQGPGSLLALPSGSIASDLRAIALDERTRIATYELLVANETISPVATFAYAIGATPGGMMSWSTITVPSFASIAVTIDVPLPPRGKEQRVVVELHAEDAHLTLDANAPQSRKRIGPLGIAALAAAGIIVLGTSLYNANKPRVVALAAPSTVVAGKPFAVAYVLSGGGNASYVVETTDGLQVRRGNLDRARTAMILDVPPSRSSQGFDLRITAAGGLGNDTRIAHFTAVATPPTARQVTIIQRIAAPPPAPGALPSISLSSDTVVSGAPIGVTYPVAGASGTVTLFDQSNGMRAQTLLDRNGHATLVAPAVAQDQPFRVVVQAQSGNSNIESAAALIVKAQTAPTAPPLPPQPAAVSGGGQTTVESGLPFGVPVGTIRSGSTLRIPIVRHEDALRVGLSTAEGNELSMVDVPLSQNEVALQVPTVRTPTSYLIVGTYRHGVGQETVVHRVTVNP